MADSQNRSEVVTNTGANFASSVSGKGNNCERSNSTQDQPLEDILKPSPLNALKRSAQSLMITQYTRAFKGVQHPKVEQTIENSLKEEPLTINVAVSEPITPKTVELSTLDEEKHDNEEEVVSGIDENFEFDPFVEHSKDELQYAIEQARLNAMKKHELIEDSEFQYKSKLSVQDHNQDVFEKAKALADLAIKDGLDKSTVAPKSDEDSSDFANNLLHEESCALDHGVDKPHEEKEAFKFQSSKSPFAYIKTSLTRVVPKDRFYVDDAKGKSYASFVSHPQSAMGNINSHEQGTNQLPEQGASQSQAGAQYEALIQSQLLAKGDSGAMSPSQSQGSSQSSGQSQGMGQAMGQSQGMDVGSAQGQGLGQSALGQEASFSTVVGVGQPHSAYDDVFGGDNHHLPSEHHYDRLDPSQIETPLDPMAMFDGAQKSDLEQDINESSVRYDDPNYWAQGGLVAAEESTLPASAFACDGPEDNLVLHNDSGQINCLGIPGLKSKDKNGLNIPFKMHQHVDLAHVGVSAQERLGVQGLVTHPKIDNSMAHYRGGYMPCYFLYDNGEDRYLLDEGSCRLIGITYTGDWIPSSYINNQLSLIDEDQIFSVFFNPSEGNKIFSHVKIKQGPHKGERLYISGSIIQRDDTGIAMLVSGYFTQVKSKFMECLCKFMNHSSSFDIDTFTGEVQFGAAYHIMLGLEDNDRMPRTVKEFEENFIHPEDLMVYCKQNDIIYNPSLGDYYESIYRIKHRGGYYIWCIDRGLVIERKNSGMASRIIGTTTNIDVVRSNFERLKRSIYQDPLTGLHNRFYLNTRYKYFTMEESQPLSLVYVDISGLKVINDYLGHAKGDELVKLSAQILSNDVYLDHEVVRLSGDEFLLIFTNCSDEQCKAFINRFAATLDERNRNKEFPLPIYFGFGIATLNEIEDGDTFLRCEARADVRLQEYKTAHRTRIYTELQAFIENALGQKVVFNDNRRLEYLDKADNDEPDVVPSNQLNDQDRQERAGKTNEASQAQALETKGTNLQANVPSGAHESKASSNEQSHGVGIVPSWGASGKVPRYQGSPYGVKYNRVHPSLIPKAAKIEETLVEKNRLSEEQIKDFNETYYKYCKPASGGVATVQDKEQADNLKAFKKKSALAAISRMQYQTGSAAASAEVFMAAGLQKIEQELAQAQRQIEAHKAPLAKHSAFEVDNNGTKGSYGSGDVYQVAQSSVPEDLINQNSLTMKWDEDTHNKMNLDGKISAEQERLLILAAEQAALDDMRYAQNSVTMPDDLSAGFGSLEVEVSDLT